jgi:hypothetical protein
VQPERPSHEDCAIQHGQLITPRANRSWGESFSADERKPLPKRKTPGVWGQSPHSSIRSSYQNLLCKKQLTKESAPLFSICGLNIVHRPCDVRNEQLARICTSREQYATGRSIITVGQYEHSHDRRPGPQISLCGFVLFCRFYPVCNGFLDQYYCQPIWCCSRRFQGVGRSY